ncbi:HDOD domain-containing protein [Psychrosphaera aquimarina]|uniref:HDOD domain-containing protein n=1 Tax=Psychrosphaera aquimarina TaxID=2044854 RepID=A0ABU3R1S1_9GAMM|nr:HDOD domain-containing protein [Psychrosphaera aquimarina]MDU0113623.1 HDOD domain-containing protein [Psychrosphaera aquimarina]
MIVVNDEILSNINKTFVIPPRPDLLTELKDIMSEKDPSLMDMGNVIAKDVGLSAAILKLINSPAYGLARTVSDIKQAVMFLGFDGIYTLVQGIKLKEAFAVGKRSINLDRFWDTAEEIAQVALVIGGEVKSKVPVENLYTIGLFHDCGIPVMAAKYDDYIKVLTESNKNYERTLVNIEEATYNTNHAIIGYYLGSSWHLPKDICQLILRHHDLNFLDKIEGDIEQINYSVLKMAENIVHVERRHIAAPDWPMLKDAVLDTLGFTDDIYNDLKEDITELVFGR